MLKAFKVVVGLHPHLKCIQFQMSLLQSPPLYSFGRTIGNIISYRLGETWLDNRGIKHAARQMYLCGPCCTVHEVSDVAIDLLRELIEIYFFLQTAARGAFYFVVWPSIESEFETPVLNSLLKWEMESFLKTFKLSLLRWLVYKWCYTYFPLLYSGS